METHTSILSLIPDTLFCWTAGELYLNMLRVNVFLGKNDSQKNASQHSPALQVLPQHPAAPVTVVGQYNECHKV